MSLIDQTDELVQSITLYNRKPALLHGYFAPFLILNFLWILYWLLCNDFWQFYECALIGISIITVSQIICCCSCFWSVHVRTFLMYRKVTNPQLAKFAKVVPLPNNGETEIVHLQLNKDKDKTIIYLTFQSIKYIFDNDRNLFKPLRFPIDKPLSSYLSHRGYLDENSLTDAQKLFGPNIQTMFIPKTLELFVERATAPFFIFQMFCSILWMFDTFFYFTLFTIFMLIMFEFTVVKQQIRSMSDILSMGNKPYNINVQRNRRWKQCSTTELIPGDIVSITRSVNDNMVPCDILLLKGSCIIDESLLTGESVPQMKESIEDCDRNSVLDVENHSKINVVFGGTKVVQTAIGSSSGSQTMNTVSIKSPDNGCVGYVLRTGFYTTQGKLLRTILYGVKRMTANNLESFCFIMFLLVFAIAAAAYVWIKGSLDPTRSRYKLFFECVLIITSVVPPELPIQLSLAVNSSLISLAKLAITCTEPFRLPFAGKVEICCFDKTGTLTSDDLIVEGVAGIVTHKQQTNEILPMDNLPMETAQVLGTCHSLAILDGKIIGDPLEKAILASLKWNLLGTDMVKPNRSKIQSLKIVHRYHFTSALKRMTVIASSHPTGATGTSTSDLNYIVAVKGAAEILAPMFQNRPDNYEQLYLSYSRKGARVLALGYRDLGVRSSAEIRGLIAKRPDLESSLKFVGFAVISCPLKPDSYAIIQEIVRSSHKVLMITGDNALTACHVAKVLDFSKLELLTLVEHADHGWMWQNVCADAAARGDEQWSLDRSRLSGDFHKSYDLCVDGKALDFLRNEYFEYLQTIMPYVSVFARCAPKQKEFIILTLKSLGFATLMCGDGTNDVGALKHAHVGVAILTNNPNAKVRPVVENQFGELETLKLGDASIAAPFSSRRSSIKCVTQIIKQGRCTLVTTLQMFKIIALNSLISAYSNSVLFLDNIKLNDSQATFQAFLLCICLLCVSKSQPLKALSKQRPLPTIFNLYTISTVFLQFINHFVCLIYLVHEASIRSINFNNSTEIIRNATNSMDAIVEAASNVVANSSILETTTAAASSTETTAAEIPPNIMNSTVYVISMMLQISNFAVNYRGHPFMQSLRENTMLLYSLLVTAASVFAVVFGLFPDLTEMLGLIDFPSENILLLVLILNYVLSFVIDYICLWLFGEGKLTINK